MSDSYLVISLSVQPHYLISNGSSIYVPIFTINLVACVRKTDGQGEPTREPLKLIAFTRSYNKETNLLFLSILEAVLDSDK